MELALVQIILMISSAIAAQLFNNYKITKYAAIILLLSPYIYILVSKCRLN